MANEIVEKSIPLFEKNYGLLFDSWPGFSRGILEVQGGNNVSLPIINPKMTGGHIEVG